jgi:hypothetical protein
MPDLGSRTSQNIRICCGQMIEWPAASASDVARAVADMTHAELSDRIESGSVARHSSPNGAAVAHRMKRGPHLWGRPPDQRSSRATSSGPRRIDSPTKARRLPYRHAGASPSNRRLDAREQEEKRGLASADCGFQGEKRLRPPNMTAVPGQNSVSRGGDRARRQQKTGKAPESGRAKKLERGVAGGLGFEPRLTESESAVLPLDDPPKSDVAAGDRDGGARR